MASNILLHYIRLLVWKQYFCLSNIHFKFIKKLTFPSFPVIVHTLTVPELDMATTTSSEGNIQYISFHQGMLMVFF